MDDRQADDRDDSVGLRTSDVEAEVGRLGEQYGEEYFSNYGHGPFGYEAGAPYRPGESLWQGYFRQIAELVCERSPRTVLDAGCAIGFLVDALRQRGVEAWGVDISDYAIAHVPPRARPFCWVGSVTEELDRDFDLVVCLEVLEHLPPHLAAMAVANLCTHANEVLFSASPDGFRDPTHLNVQPTDYWVELFARSGYFRNLDVDASVVSPQAIHFVKATQSAAAVARAYERWHWRTLTELRDLRAAREIGNTALLRAERAEAELAERRRVPEVVVPSAEEAAALEEQLGSYKAAAERAQAEIAAIAQTRLFRYTAGARRVYGALRLRTAPLRRLPAPERSAMCSIDAPGDGEIIDSDLLVPAYGWVLPERGQIARVDAFADGVPCGNARLGIVRPEIGAEIDTPEAIICGFETMLDLRAFRGASRKVAITFEAETMEGERHPVGAVRVRLKPPVRDAAGRASRETAVRVPSRFRVPSRSKGSAEVRLLVFTHHLGLGGGQLYLFELLRLLSRDTDFSATVVAPTDGPLKEATEALGIPVVVNGFHPVVSLGEYETRLREMNAWARGGRFNAILGNTLGSFPNIDLAVRLELPAIWAIHESFDLDSFWRVAYGSFDAVDPRVKRRGEGALMSASAVVFEADATRRLLAHYGDPSRFVTIPYGIDVEAVASFAESVSREEARRHLGLPEDAKILLCLGTVEPRKAQTMLAQAFRKVASRYPDTILAFVGAGTDVSSSGLANFIEQVGLAKRIQLVAVTPDIQWWYRAADAFVCASDIESLPRTVLEAMAYSIPVLATRVFGIPELIEDGVTGYLCEPRDVRELVHILERFLSGTADEHRAIGAAGANKVRELHDSRGYADSYRRLLKGLIDDPTAHPSNLLVD